MGERNPKNEKHAPEIALNPDGGFIRIYQDFALRFEVKIHIMSVLDLDSS